MLHRFEVHVLVRAMPFWSGFRGSFHAPSPSVTHRGTQSSMQLHGWSNFGPQFLAKYDGGFCGARACQPLREGACGGMGWDVTKDIGDV